MLRVCDTPAALGLLAPRPLTIMEASSQDFAQTAAAYAAASASDRLTIK
jgi:hypothetical protein